MNKPLLDKSSGQGYLPTPSYGKKIKRLTKVTVNINDDPQLAKRYRVKNSKWAQFIHTIEYQNQNTFSSFKALKWCKSLQITSIHVSGLQCGGTVGHFHGELKHLAKCARYLKTLDFEAGIMTKKRFIDYRRWLMRQKYLTDLSFVPFWFPVEKQEDVLDWDVVRTKGVVSLLHSLRAQIRELTLHGFMQPDLVKKLEMKEFSQLRNFAIAAASRPGGYFDGPEEFSELHLDFVKKVLECKNLERIGLRSENDSTDKEIWKSLKEMILPVKKPLTVDIEVDERKKKIHEWFKKNFADLPAHLKVTYSIWSTDYFLSMPDGKEDVGQNDDDEFDDDSEDEDEDEDENEDDEDKDEDGGEKDENDDGMEEEEKEEDDENGDEDEEENEDNEDDDE